MSLTQKYEFVTGVETAAAPTALPASAIGDLFVLGLQTSFTIVNNQSSPANITNLVFDKTVYRKFDFQLTIFRSAAGGSTRAETLNFSAITDGTSWEMASTGSLNVPNTGDSGMTFSITSAGQVQYVSDDNGGAYVAGTSLLKWKILDLVAV